MVQQAFRENAIAFKFLVPYSLELNPIEEFVSMLKARFHIKRIANPILSIEGCLGDIIAPENDNSTQYHNFYTNMKNRLELAREQYAYRSSSYFVM